jgi:hypothetical protein
MSKRRGEKRECKEKERRLDIRKRKRKNHGCCAGFKKKILL